MKHSKIFLPTFLLLGSFFFQVQAQDFKKEMKAIRSTLSITPDRKIDGTNNEVLFLYGRSHYFINNIMKEIKNNNYQTKIIFDIVEPPKSTNSIFEYFIHPFTFDSALVFKKDLNKFHGCTFISSKLYDKYKSKVNKSYILPSIKYYSNLKFSCKIKSNEKKVMLAYLGALNNKDPLFGPASLTE